MLPLPAGRSMTACSMELPVPRRTTRSRSWPVAVVAGTTRKVSYPDKCLTPES